MTIEKIIDHDVKAKDRLPRFLDGATNFNSLIDIATSRTQDLENELFNLLDQRNLTNAIGLQLDGLGQILNLSREVGQSDTDYRQALIGETGQLALSGQIESLINVFNALTSAVTSDVVEFFPASVLLTAFFDGDLVDPNVDQSIIDAMDKVRAAGVNLDLRYAEETTFLEFSDISEIDINGDGPISTNNGLGDEALTEGGGLSRLIG